MNPTTANQSNLILCSGLILFLLTGATFGQGFRRAFTSSVAGNGDFAQWAESGGVAGVEGADIICQTLASNAALENPQNFVAWISDSSDDAYCRLHGLGGKKNSFCDQGSLPVDAGPWLRTDDYPFAAAVPFILGSLGAVWGPLAADETGSPLPLQPAGNFVFTATSSSGTLQTNSIIGTCDEWTSTLAEPSQTMTGRAQSTTGLWSNSIQFSERCHCDGSCHLYCLEKVSGPAIEAGGPGIRLAFVTSIGGPGDMTLWPEATPGITDPLLAADSICQNLASAASLDHASTFKAYLATDSATAASRFIWDGPWWRVDGFAFANNLADFASGSAISTLHQQETGQYINARLWTGQSGPTCNNWNNDSMAFSGRIGFSAETGSLQTEGLSYACNFDHRLYCLSDREIPLVFADGFESGDTSLWSGSQP